MKKVPIYSLLYHNTCFQRSVALFLSHSFVGTHTGIMLLVSGANNLNKNNCYNLYYVTLNKCITYTSHIIDLTIKHDLLSLFYYYLVSDFFK